MIGTQRPMHDVKTSIAERERGDDEGTQHRGSIGLTCFTCLGAQSIFTQAGVFPPFISQRYVPSILVPTVDQENSRVIHSRPSKPRCASESKDSAMACSRAATSASTPMSIHQPAPRDSISLHGAPLLTMTGVPEANASATVMPKFSECVGNTNSSALRYAVHFASPYRASLNSTCFNLNVAAICFISSR